MNAERQENSITLQPQTAQRGFTLTELAIATLVLLVGLVAVMQIVPSAMQANLTNRNDTSSTVVAQRLRDLLIQQPLSATTLADPLGVFPCGAGVVCNLGGGVAVGDFIAGAPLRNNGEIDFTAARVPNYSFNFVDPNDPTGAPYDVRWTVVTSVRNIGQLSNVVLAKRFVVGARRLGTTTPAVSVFSSWVSR